MAKIALGTWAWGAGAFGGDAVFGSKTDVENLKPVFDAAMKNGLNLSQLAEVYENSVEKMALASIDRMGIDYIDMYWIHNPMDVERWTP